MTYLQKKLRQSGGSPILEQVNDFSEKILDASNSLTIKNATINQRVDKSQM
jgi:hypothetical protein